MNYLAIKSALDQSFKDLGAFSVRYEGEKKRYLYTIKQVLLLPKDELGKILDIGTGIGIIPHALQKLSYQTEGLEYFIFPSNKKGKFSTASIDEVETLRALWKKLNLKIHEKNIITDDLNQLGTFNLLISEAVLEHLKDPKTFLKRCHEILAPRGYLILATPNQSKLINRFRFLLGKSIYWPIKEFFTDGENFIGHWREYTLKELVSTVNLAGFRVIRAENINLLSSFRGLKSFRKNFRALINLLSFFIPGSRDMNYVLCQKEDLSFGVNNKTVSPLFTH